ncbi:MAG: mannitol dehydrogenase family protein [Rhizobiales bacterium]|nr:mannitol dehydrogenase family protein [Hyphomicrobiales bacterium]
MSAPASIPLPRLSDAVLPVLPAAVARPAYDRGKVTAGIVHLGVGAFHRAHQAVFADDALGRGETGWGIVAASLRSAATRDALAPQDCLYTFALRDGSSRPALRVIGSIKRIIVAPEEPEVLIAALAAPQTRIVTLTITEKGYGFDIAAGRLDGGDPAIRADLGTEGPPVSALGFLFEGLRRRRAEGAPPVTLIPCDNLPKNGETLRKALTEFSRRKEPALADWIGDNVAFASSMVDRIVPGTTDADREAIDAALGARDAWPVVAEPAFDWIVEDRFPRGRPPFEASGVRFVADVEPYEHMKLRLLNGAHTAIAALGRLAGFETVPEAVGHPLVRRFLERLWDESEATLRIDPQVSAEYRGKLLPRFANPALPHKTAQIATDASLKVPQRLLEPLRARLAAGQAADALVFVVALWIRSCGGVDDAGKPFSVNDPGYERWPGKPEAGAGAAATVEAFLRFPAVFGDDLPRNTAFAVALRDALGDIMRLGALGALAERVGA